MFHDDRPISSCGPEISRSCPYDVLSNSRPCARFTDVYRIKTRGGDLTHCLQMSNSVNLNNLLQWCRVFLKTRRILDKEKSMDSIKENSFLTRLNWKRVEGNVAVYARPSLRFSLHWSCVLDIECIERCKNWNVELLISRLIFIFTKHIISKFTLFLLGSPFSSLNSAKNYTTKPCRWLNEQGAMFSSGKISFIPVETTPDKIENRIKQQMFQHATAKRQRTFYTLDPHEL